VSSKARERCERRENENEIRAMPPERASEVVARILNWAALCQLDSGYRGTPVFNER
jgi:hypothetical protein